MKEEFAGKSAVVSSFGAESVVLLKLVADIDPNTPILFLNKGLGDDNVLRRHGKSNRKEFAKFTRADGQIVHGEVSDISVTGVSLKTDVRPAIGEFVLIAQIAGRVARHHGDGIDIDFVGNERAFAESTHRLNAVG